MMDFSGLKVFTLGGLSSVCATFFTNPLEVIKTRMQLQGELAARGSYVESYRNVVHAFIQIARHEGPAALQKGLSPALCFQFTINATRLSIYDAAVAHKLTKTKNGTESLAKGAFFGGIGGIVGAAISNPFFLVKTQLQSHSAQEIAVGHQHKHLGMSDAFKTIIKQSGFRGLYRSVRIASIRGCLGSGAQLTSFGYTKDLLKRHNIASGNPYVLSFVSGMLAGTVMSLAINPPDVIASRLYNQPLDANGKGVMYSGVVDCFWKVLKTEGIFGLYKGVWAQYIRIGPHSTLTLFFFDCSRKFFEV